MSDSGLKWTPPAIQQFYEILAQTGNVTRACAAVGVSRASAYKTREEDEYFRELWADALEVFYDNLEEVAARRAQDGWDEPVYYKGAVCGTRRRYSDRLMEFLLRGGRPDKYKDRAEVQQHHSGGAVVQIVHMDNGRDDGEK